MKAMEVITYNIDDDDSQIQSDPEIEDFQQQNPRIREDPVPDSLKRVFGQAIKPVNEDRDQPSLFRKIKDAKTMNIAADSSTVQNEAIKKAEDMLKKHNIFNNVPVTGGHGLQPLNNIRLKQKERRVKKDETAGKAWGEMPRVTELTEEMKADLKALKLRNFIYPSRFYKTNDSKKLP